MKHLIIYPNLNMKPKKDQHVLLVHNLSFGVW